jgi:hypothetical protein
MRMWMVDPTQMCSKHLLGEHVELHMFMGSLNKGISMDGYVRNNLLELPQIAKRHEMLVAEMRRRGYRHQSPISAEHVHMLEEYYPEEVVNYRIDREAAARDLFERCPRCKERMK